MIRAGVFSPAKIRGAVGSLAAVALSGGAGCGQLLGDVAVGPPLDVSVSPILTPLGGKDCGDGGADGACIACRPGAYRCQGLILQRCQTDSADWEFADQCASAALCDPQQARCEPPLCAPDQYECSELGELRRCNPDQTGFAPVAECASAAFCSTVRGQEGCVSTACSPGQQRCNGPSIEQCREDQTGYDLLPTRCASAPLCRVDAPGVAHCEPPACSAGQFACDGRVLQRCNDDSTQWSVISRCVSAALCDAGQQRCTPPVCALGDQRCTGSVLERCSPDQSGFVTVADCVNPLLCDTRVMVCLTTPATIPPPTTPPATTPLPPAVTSTDPYTFKDEPRVSALGLTLAQLTAPVQWTQVDTSPWLGASGAVLGPRLIISTDTVRFAGSFDIPGVYFSATAQAPVDPTAILALFDLSAHCTLGTTEAYSDLLYTGTRQNWTNCGTTGAQTVVVAATPSNRAFGILVAVTLLAARDDAARQSIWNSFEVTAP
jgi:hypothetical protein